MKRQGPWKKESAESVRKTLHAPECGSDTLVEEYILERVRARVTHISSESDRERKLDGQSRDEEEILAEEESCQKVAGNRVQRVNWRTARDWRNAVWLPGSVSEAFVTENTCTSCSPGPVFKIQFKFRRLEIPPNYSVQHLGTLDNGTFL
ncbi:hypothetical protein FXO38_26585 [Capsicum annuum]|nr:hypothetical protein FXO37_33562 [Capsicum annuum]KAF3631617.1 hypothetical protein FXO38_26585 [Capsicum annuum]